MADPRSFENYTAFSPPTERSKPCSSSRKASTTQPSRELRNQFSRVRVWDADNLLRAVLRNYDKLS